MLYTVYLLSVQEGDGDYSRPVMVFQDEEDAHLFAEQHLLSGERKAEVVQIDYYGNPTYG